jgi:hypothetical protein
MEVFAAAIDLNPASISDDPNADADSVPLPAVFLFSNHS